MTEEERRVLDAAREWLTERSPKDATEKALFAAVARAYPEDLDVRETCDCGDNECDECPTAAQVGAMIAQCERESMPAEAS
jgi:hypothetical protein